METMTFAELFRHFDIQSQDSRIIRKIVDDSREVEENTLFVAWKQASQRVAYIKEALNKGGVVLCEEAVYQDPNVYVLKDLAKKCSRLLDLVYDRYEECCIIGVSGTNGKTSVASYVTQLLTLQDAQVMQIGTGFVKMSDGYLESKNTTPGMFALARLFDLAKQKQMTHIVMEVSSHAIAQNRIARIRYDAIIYTNITQDHLDYHLTKTQYRFTKFKLANFLKADGCIIYNSDQEAMQALIQMHRIHCITYGMHAAHMAIEKVKLSDHDVRFLLNGYAMHAKLLGEMNIYNVAAALALMRVFHVPYDVLQEHVIKLMAVKGRMEVIYQGDFQVWIDYAHTPDALEKLLIFARRVCKRRVISVFGCGGNRDITKRSSMAKIGAKHSDVVIYTCDNPRYERICDILKDMQKERFSNACIFEHRYYAIKHAVKIAQNSDIIIIAGKGSEGNMSVKGKQYPCSDEAWVRELLDQGGKTWKLNIC